MNQERLNKVLEGMKEREIPQMLISDAPAIFYLTGKWIHTGERLIALYLNENGNHKLFINELFPVTEDLGVEKVWFNDNQDGVEIISKYVEKDKVMGVDKNWPARFLLRLMELEGGSKFVNGSIIIDRARMFKDEKEKELMRASSKANDAAMEKLYNLFKENQDLSEKEVGERLAKIYSDLGAERFSFDPIVGYGANAADPHHENDGSKLKEGDCIVLDIGCVKDSYCSDMTRVFFYKSVPEHSKKVYDTVVAANMAGIAAVKPGVRFCDIDKASRDVIEKAGYGKYFTHRTGHSIGIEDHDLGDVSAVNTEEIKPGMIFSIEPGIYLPGEVGVRIEDLVLVTEDGCEVLNKYSKELTIIE
ncbi:aminopeptidase P family protein [Clostridium botulinum]|uniref:Aminopeptidase P family protein n=1 Tax=Clostridium botulinum TaxID=1491 RepID=A0A6B4H4W0_CLOBO|nr:Xaa-Pro peptidase family protein [Clostridium botulinum]NFD78131.1 aminopeptidase P family protein [Clostridium botulinum]NFD85160.1 aminopeptidase P family protein [Clostridium botulinum]NFE08731.1 aminopeptidase P family protein [Clostridium botulinum]NFE34406.1 aminopeptidase P family protein [Clostridium botulinum]NFE49394.1 aminopeptidase P family protein [Clostridium botulinum]